jgi:glycosyltransferase involved in cell wall biosynthesis
MKKRVIFLPADFAGCGQFRMIQPAKDLKQMNTEDLEFELVHDKVSNNTNFGTLVSLLKDYDAVVFQRVASPKILGIMKEVKKMGKKVYMDIDDALLHVSKSNPAYRVWNPKSDAWTTLKEALKLCDKIFFSTPQLSEVYAIGNCAVFFNGLNLQDPIYLPEFLQLFDIPKDRKLYVQHKPFEEWPPVMSMFDVSLAPIVTGIFNSCKSELKVLEAGVWGVPSVCTMEAPYKRFHELSGGGNALVYRNDVNEWVRKISAALDDSEKREEMVLKTKNTIESVYNLREINKKRVNFFREELF